MGFTTPCFIRKNTQELRKKLEELGYEILNSGNSGRYHKATVNELIEHFKTKEEQ